MYSDTAQTASWITERKFIPTALVEGDIVLLIPTWRDPEVAKTSSKKTSDKCAFLTTREKMRKLTTNDGNTLQPSRRLVQHKKNSQPSALKVQ